MNTQSQRESLMELDRSRATFVRLWFIGGGCVFGLFTLESIFSKEFSGHLTELWSWFVPTLIPTLSLIGGVLYANAIHAAKPDLSSPTTYVTRMAHNLGIGLSSTYLVVLASTILIGLVRVTDSANPHADDVQTFYAGSTFWLGPLQGLVVANLGVLFASKSQTATGGTTDQGLQIASNEPGNSNVAT